MLKKSFCCWNMWRWMWRLLRHSDVQNPRRNWKCDVISAFFIVLGFLLSLRCKSWVPVLSPRQGTARTSKAYRTSYQPYWALHSKSRVNYTIVFRCHQTENASTYCDSIVYLLWFYYGFNFCGFFSVLRYQLSNCLNAERKIQVEPFNCPIISIFRVKLSSVGTISESRLLRQKRRKPKTEWLRTRFYCHLLLGSKFCYNNPSCY